MPGVPNNLCDSIGMLRDGKGVALVVSRQKWLQQHMWPASMSPTRPARPMKMKARLAVPLLSRFLNSRLLGVPNNPRSVTGMLNVDKGIMRVDNRWKKLKKLSV